MMCTRDRRGRSLSERCYRILLRGYSRKFRTEAGAELESVFCEAYRDSRSRGKLFVVLLWIRTMLDLLVSVSDERLEHLRIRSRISQTRGQQRMKSRRGVPWMTGVVLGEFKVAVRRLLRTPGFSIVAVLTLALGITTNAIVFALIQGVYLKPLPFLDPGRLVYLQESDDRNDLLTSYTAFEYFADHSSSLNALGAYVRGASVLRDGDDVIRVDVAMVSANLFDILGVSPFLGRGFLTEEDEPGADRVMILSHATWLSHFGGRPDVVGGSVTIGRGTFTVAGIMPRGFRFPGENVHCWVPLGVVGRSPTSRNLTLVGRLAPNTSIEHAREEVMVVGRRLEVENQPAKGGEFTYVYPLKDLFVDPSYKAVFAALAVAVGMLLLIAGANLTTLLLARASTRTVEIAVRKALGATGFRTVLSHLAEPVTLALASAGVGIVGAFWALDLVLMLAPVAIPRQAEIGLNPMVVVFALGLSLVAGVVIGLSSLWRGHSEDLVAGVHSAGRLSMRRRLQGAFTIGQAAFTFALLAGVSLMVRTVANLHAVDAGFDPTDALAIQLGLPRDQYPDAVSRMAFHDRVVEGALRLPGIAAAGYSSYLPLTGSWADLPILVEGSELPGDERTIFEYDLVTPGFFDAMGIELRQGRFLEDWDREDSPLVAVVNETAAGMHFPNGDALGRRFSVGSVDQETWLTVVGVVEDVRHHHLTEEANPKFYIPFPQYPQPWPHGLNLVLRMSEIDWQSAARMVREMINGMGVGGPLVEISPLEAPVSRLVAGPRFNALVLMIFTSAALSLAVLGVYGLVSIGVAERRKEIGLKVALGADMWRVQREILWRGFRLTLIGVVLGFPLALGLGRIMMSMLFGVAFYDAKVLVAAGLILTAVSAVACIIPSIRATGVDPVAALRIE